MISKSVFDTSSIYAFLTKGFPIKIRVSKGLPGSAAWQMAQKNIVQVAFVRWRGDSKIVEANAEHDFRLKGSSECSVQKQNKFCGTIFLCNLPSGTAGKTF